jgi:hypothetical protein
MAGQCGQVCFNVSLLPEEKPWPLYLDASVIDPPKDDTGVQHAEQNSVHRREEPYEQEQGG